MFAPRRRSACWQSLLSEGELLAVAPPALVAAAARPRAQAFPPCELGLPPAPSGLSLLLRCASAFCRACRLCVARGLLSPVSSQSASSLAVVPVPRARAAQVSVGLRRRLRRVPRGGAPKVRWRHLPCAIAAIDGSPPNAARRRPTRRYPARRDVPGVLSWLGDSPSRFWNVAHETDSVPLSIGDRGDPYLPSIHARDHVRFLERCGSGSLDLGVGLLDVTYVVEQHRMLPVSVLTLAFGSGEHQLHATAIEE